VFGPLSAGAGAVTAQADAVIRGAAAGDNLGRGVAGVGDVDNDGYDDVLVAALGADTGGTDAGAAYLFHGPISGTLSASAADATLVGAMASDIFAEVAWIGDVNSDGVDDFMVGAQMNSSYGPAAGAAYVFHGPVSGTVGATSADVQIYGEAFGDEAGSSNWGAGDLNGDGVNDLVALLDRPGGALPLRLVDTAGLRDTDDEVEKLGIEVSGRYLAQAQVVLACGASPDDIAHTMQVVSGRTTAPVIPVHTKWDLQQTDGRMGAGNPVCVSAESGEGLAELLARIDDVVQRAHPSAPHDGVMLTRERHRTGLSIARDEVATFVSAWEDGALPAPVAAVHLHTAREAIAELIGSVETEEILERVFRDFCIGK